MCYHLKKLISLFSLSLISGCLVAQQSPWLTSQYWKDQLFTDILPYWTNSIVDDQNQSFHTSLNESWQPLPVDTLRFPSMIARHLFSYSAAYMLSGEKEYLNMAQSLKDYLFTHCYDQEFGGWFNSISPEGQVIDAGKSSFVQFYAITGLTLYYNITKDPEVYSIIRKSNDLMESKVWDSAFGGYYNRMNRDWTLADDGKSFSPQLAPISGYLLYLYLSTREEVFLLQIKRIMDMVAEKMVDPATGWVLENFDRHWQYTPSKTGKNEINIGHTIEVAWVLARVQQVIGTPYQHSLLTTLDNLNGEYGFDKKTGFWYAEVGREDKSLHTPFTHWWIQAYGMMSDLVLWEVFNEEGYLKRFENAGKIWQNSFLDKEGGDTPLTVGLNGEVMKGNKATQYKSSYHNAELAFLNYLYLKCYWENEPFSLYFYLDKNTESQELYPLPIEARDFSISAVMANGIPVQEVALGQFGVKIPPLSEPSVIEVQIQPKK